MVDLNANLNSDIYTQPTDPDTLKILEKIKKNFNESDNQFHDTGKIEEARTAVLQGIERRNSDPNRAFVNTHRVEENPTDRKVTGLLRKINEGTQETSTTTLGNRAKKHS